MVREDGKRRLSGGTKEGHREKYGKERGREKTY